MAHSFFKFDFGRDGMPGNMGQANWQRLAKYMKKAQDNSGGISAENEQSHESPDRFYPPEFEQLKTKLEEINGAISSGGISAEEAAGLKQELDELVANAYGQVRTFSGDEWDRDILQSNWGPLDESYLATNRALRNLINNTKSARVAQVDDQESGKSDAGSGPWSCMCGCGCRQKHLNPTRSYCGDCAAGDCPSDDEPGPKTKLMYCDECQNETPHSLSTKPVHSGWGKSEPKWGCEECGFVSAIRHARVAHRVWDIVSNDGIPTAHRKVDEMTVINRDHKRLADTSELDVGDQVIMFTDGVQVHARIASVQNDGSLVLNVDGSLVSNIDPGFVFLDE